MELMGTYNLSFPLSIINHNNNRSLQLNCTLQPRTDLHCTFGLISTLGWELCMSLLVSMFLLIRFVVS